MENNPATTVANAVVKHPLETVLTALAVFAVCTAIQEIAANYGHDWRRYLPRPAPATPGAAA